MGRESEEGSTSLHCTPTPIQSRPVADIDGDVRLSACDASAARLAVCTRQGAIQIWERDQGQSSAWSRAGTIQPGASGVTAIAWAPSACGCKLALGCADGSFSIWAASPTTGAGGDTWRQRARRQASSSPLVALECAAPTWRGVLLVAADAAGDVRVFESLDLLELQEWDLQGAFSLLEDVGDGSRKRELSAVALTWRPSPGPLSLLIGTSGPEAQAGRAMVWQHRAEFGRWQMAAELAVGGGSRRGVVDVAWAANHGRLYELLAVAAGNAAEVWRWDAAAEDGGDDGPPPARRLAELLPGGGREEVLEVSWDLNGSTLASSGTDSCVRLWRATVGGEWLQRGVVGGT